MGPIGARKAVVSVWDCGQRGNDSAAAHNAKRLCAKSLYAIPLQVAVCKVCWVPNSTRLVVGLADGGLRLWDFSGGVASLTAERDEPDAESLMPRASTIAVAKTGGQWHQFFQ